MANCSFTKPPLFILVLLFCAFVSFGQTSDGIVDNANRRIALNVSASGVQTPPESQTNLPMVVCNGTELTISTNNSTLGSVLTEVHKCIGVKIDMPDGAAAIRVFNKLGPGPAQKVLVDLLTSSGYDYVIGSSQSDPDKVETILLMTRQDDAPTGVISNANAFSSRAYLYTHEDGRFASPPAEESLSLANSESGTTTRAVAAATMAERTEARADQFPVSNEALVSFEATRVARVSSSLIVPNTRSNPIMFMGKIGETSVPAQALIKESRWRDELARFGASMNKSEDELTNAARVDNIRAAYEDLARSQVSVHWNRDLRGNAGVLGPVFVPAVDRRQMAIRELATIQNENDRLTGYVYPNPMDRDAGNYVAGEARIMRVATKSTVRYQTLLGELSETIWQADRRLEIIVPATLTIIILLVHTAARSFKKTNIIPIAVTFFAIGAIWSLCFMHYNLTVVVWVGMLALIAIFTEAVVFRLVMCCICACSKVIRRFEPRRSAVPSSKSCLSFSRIRQPMRYQNSE